MKRPVATAHKARSQSRASSTSASVAADDGARDSPITAPAPVVLVTSDGERFELSGGVARFEASHRWALGRCEGRPATTEPFGGDELLMLSNVRRGTEALRPHVERLRAVAPGIDWALAFEAPRAAEALVYAVDVVPARARLRPRFEAAHARLQSHRLPALLCARALAMYGLLPMVEVEAIEEGKGWLDAARDGIALAKLYRERSAAIAGQHPMNADRLREMEVLGAWMIDNVTPDGAPSPTASPAEAESLRQRDAIAGLLRELHAMLRAGGYLLWGEGYGEHVPALKYRPATRSAATDDTVDDDAPDGEPTDPTKPVDPPTG